MTACALAGGSREEEYLAVAGRYKREELNEFSIALALLVQEMEVHAFTDPLGRFYTEIVSKSSRDSRGEFYTPPEISSLMARCLFNVEAAIERGVPVTVHEPAVGSGGIILELAKLFSPVATGQKVSHVDLLRVSAVDVNPIACDMSFINFSLWGIPATILQGNVLTDLAELTGHKNIHWARVGEDRRREREWRAKAMMDFIKSSDTRAEEKSSPRATPAPALEDIRINRDHDQVSFDFGS